MSGTSIHSLESQNAPIVAVSNLQNNLGHLRPQLQQGIPVHSSYSQRLPLHIIQSPGLQSQETPNQIASCQVRPQMSTSVHDSSNQMGQLPSTQQGSSLSHSNTTRQHGLNINISPTNLGPNQVLELGSINNSSHLSQQSSATERPVTSGLSGSFPVTTASQTINFNPVAQSQLTETVHQEEEHKLDVAELISFD